MKYIVIIAVLVSLNALAHSGRTDSSGCHTDRKNGGYHCHQSEDVTPDKTREPASVDEQTEKSNQATKQQLFDETK